MVDYRFIDSLNQRGDCCWSVVDSNRVARILSNARLSIAFQSACCFLHSILSSSLLLNLRLCDIVLKQGESNPCFDSSKTTVSWWQRWMTARQTNNSNDYDRNIFDNKLSSTQIYNLDGINQDKTHKPDFFSL